MMKTLIQIKFRFYMNEVILICNDLLTTIVIQIGTSSLKILCELLDVITSEELTIKEKSSLS